jgi:hypothetical protein
MVNSEAANEQHQEKQAARKLEIDNENDESEEE